MVKALFDTNILIDYLKGSAEAQREFARHYDPAISIVTWMEVMVGAAAPESDAINAFLSGFDLVHLDEIVAREAVILRRRHRMKLPDAIVWASATTHARLLVTRSTKDFPSDDPGVRVPYLEP